MAIVKVIAMTMTVISILNNDNSNNNLKVREWFLPVLWFRFLYYLQLGNHELAY